MLSWLPIDQGSPLYQMLFRVTEPIIEPIRRILPQSSMIDLSPMAAIFVLIFLGQLVLNLQASS